MLNITLNKINGDWDHEKLNQIFKELQKDIDIELLGFDIEEINDIVSTLILQK
ncbi:hypothetical protein [Tissierella praeacuta]|uniref:hypothetical protein n=1 Tax=Tissierella praeacuta TaxID=43131 RepID=UPI00333F2F5E